MHTSKMGGVIESASSAEKIKKYNACKAFITVPGTQPVAQ